VGACSVERENGAPQFSAPRTTPGGGGWRDSGAKPTGQ